MSLLSGFNVTLAEVGLLCEASLAAFAAIADRAYVLDDGHIVYAGSAAELGADEDHVRALAVR